MWFDHLGAQLYHAFDVVQEIPVLFAHSVGRFAVEPVLVQRVELRDAPVPTRMNHGDALVLGDGVLVHIALGTSRLHDGVTPSPVTLNA